MANIQVVNVMLIVGFIRKARERMKTLISHLCDQFMISRKYVKILIGFKIRILTKVIVMIWIQFINKSVINRNTKSQVINSANGFINIFPVLILYFTISCNGGRSSIIEKEIKDNYNFSEIKFELNNSSILSSKDFIDSIYYIPLETTPESEFSDVSQLEIVGDSFIILDDKSNSILFFNKKGEYLKKISSKNQDIPTPYVKIERFTIDRNQNIISFKDMQSQYFYEFDFQGNFIQTILKTESDYNIEDYFYLNGYKINFNSFRNELKRDISLPSITIHSKNKITSSYLFFDPNKVDFQDIYGANKYFFRSKDNQLLFTRPYDYNIYMIDSLGQMEKFSRIILPPENSIPENFLTSDKYKGKRQFYTTNNKSIKYMITDVYLIDKFLSITLRGKDYRNVLIYNLKTDRFISCKNYISDYTTYFLPVFGNTILGLDNDKFITAINSASFINSINSHIGKAHYLESLPENVKKIYSKGNNQNPVLILAKVK